MALSLGVPVIVLNGFLGAGKTTLLRSLLVQAYQRGLHVAAIVNEMSELDIDGVLVASTEVVSTEQHTFVAIANDSISSRSGIAKLDAALDRILAARTPDLILLETSGSSHPLALVNYLREQRKVFLKGLLTLVDTVMINADYAGGKALIPALNASLARGQRGIENLLVEQMMFSSQLLLTKHDRLPFLVVEQVALALQPINPHIAITAVPWGNLSLDTLLSMPDYDHHRVALLSKELESVVDDAGPVTSRVIRDERPFHPQRLWDTCHQLMGQGIWRSKGFFWLPGRDDLALLWNQAAGSISLEFISYWKAGVLNHSDSPLTAEEKAALRDQITRTGGRFGDRHCHLTVIGTAQEADTFTAALERCFLTEAEIDRWEKGDVFVDPWPHKISRLKGV